MPSRRRLLAMFCGLGGSVMVSGCLGWEDDDTDVPATAEVPLEKYDTTEVDVVSTGGEVLGSVMAAIADTSARQQLGLSDTEQLPADWGMLFVFDSSSEMTFHMPDMSFGIDIVFADSEGIITTIHHAEEPAPDEDGTEAHHRYQGQGQYVLEVVYDWTTERGVSAGDVLDFEL